MSKDKDREPSFISDFDWGEFMITANGHYDHERGAWLKPWTDLPDRAVIGYRIDKHPSGETVGYTYLTVDPSTGVMRWYQGRHGMPERDAIIAEWPYAFE
jgi:hypothetical protein